MNLPLNTGPNQEQSDIDKLVEIFNDLFEKSEKTRLQMGADEPFYQAPQADKLAVIYFREDFFSSALHEIAHWTLAGAARRLQDDFGYWYEADGRTSQQQAEFERVEVKPQAVEWLLSLASNHRFHFSADNLAQNNEASDDFKQAVHQQATIYRQQGLPVRAQRLFEQLMSHFRNGEKPESACLKLV